MRLADFFPRLSFFVPAVAAAVRRGVGLVAGLLAGSAVSGVPALAVPELTTVFQVRSLIPEQAAEGREVALRAVVTYNDSPGAVFIQDATAGTFFRPRQVVTLQPGDEIELHGYTQSALYVPGIERVTFRVVGTRPVPPATPVTYGDLASGRFHYQWVAFEGVVRSVGSVDDGHAVLRLHDGTQIVEVMVNAPADGAHVEENSRVRARGLASGRINQRRQLVRPYLQSAGWTDVEEIEPSPPEQALVTTVELLTFNAPGHAGRRVRVRGTVTAAFGDGTVFIRDERGAAAAELNPFVKVEEGDRLELVGFSEMSRFSASMTDCRVSTRVPGPRPSPVETTVEALFKPGFDSELVTVQAIVVDWVRYDAGVMLILRGDGRTVRVRLAGATVGPEVGAVVRATGICQVESTDVQPYRFIPATVSLRVSSPANVIVMQSPPLWTVRRMMFVLAVALALALAGAGWILMLRRQVKLQTEVLRRKIARETAFEERQRLAREFHDTLEQDLTGVSLQLSTASARNFDEKGRGLVDASRNLIGRIQQEVRTLISDLREPEDGRTGSVDLVSLLREIAVERAIEPRPGIFVSATGDLPRIPAPMAYHLRMMVQECITNVLKHARAARIQLALEPCGDGLRLTVADDGIGFDPTVATFGKRGHFGCIGIRERCLKIGANVVWRSTPGAGTTVEVTLAAAARFASDP